MACMCATYHPWQACEPHMTHGMHSSTLKFATHHRWYIHITHYVFHTSPMEYTHHPSCVPHITHGLNPSPIMFATRHPWYTLISHLLSCASHHQWNTPIIHHECLTSPMQYAHHPSCLLHITDEIHPSPIMCASHHPSCVPHITHVIHPSPIMC